MAVVGIITIKRVHLRSCSAIKKDLNRLAHASCPSLLTPIPIKIITETFRGKI